MGLTAWAPARCCPACALVTAIGARSDGCRRVFGLGAVGANVWDTTKQSEAPQILLTSRVISTA